MNKLRIIAAARSNSEFLEAVGSDVDIIFMLAENIAELKSHADMVHSVGKKLFIHIDLAEGIGKDEYGIVFSKEQGVDGIISTRTNIIKLARKVGLFTVQRFFALDSHSIDTIVETAKLSKADMIEIMPGTLPKVIKRLKSELDMPIVAGGLIETKEEIEEAFSAGAEAISTGKSDFWELVQ